MMRLGLILLGLLLMGPQAFSGQWLAVEGRLVESDGITPIEASSVVFTLEVHPPGGTCVLYREVHSPMDMSGSNGFFSLKLGAGGSPAGLASNFTDAFNNSSTTDFTSCPFTPTSVSTRDLKVSYNAGGGVQELSVPISIGGSAFAHDAHRIGGQTIANLIQVNNSTAQMTQANLESIFAAPSDITDLRDLIDGNSGDYLVSAPAAAVGFNNQRVTDVATPTSANDAANKDYVDTNLGGNTLSTAPLGAGETGEILTWNGTQWEAQPLSAAGDVNNNGNTFTGLMTLGTNDNFGLNLETNGTSALSIDTSQGVSLAAGLGVTGGINAGDNVSLLTESELHFEDNTGGEYMGLKAPAVVTASTVLTLPDGDGAANQVLATDGSGQLIWASDSDTDAVDTVFGRTGTVVAAASDYDAAQVDNIAAGDIVATNVQDAIDELDSEKVALAGDTMSGSLNLDNESEIQLSEADGSGANYVGFKAPATLAVDVIWTLPDVIGTANQVLRNSGTPGILEWTTITIPASSVNSSSIVNTSIRGIDMDFVGTTDFSGIVDGLDTLLVYNASTGAAQEATVNDLTDGLIKRDGSNPMEGNLDLDNNEIHNLAQGTATNPSLTFNVDSDTGIYQPVADNIAFSTAASERARIDNTGNFGIGVSAPTSALDVQGRITSRPINTTTGNTGSIALRELDAGGSESVGFRAPDSVTTDILWTLPDDAGTAYQVLSRSASADGLEWATTGDFLADGSVAMTGNLKLGSNFISNGGASNGIAVTSSGNVGVGTSTPGAALDVNGAIKSTAAINNAGATVDFALGNIQYTANNCGAFNLHNMKDGATYKFIVQGLATATCFFTPYSDAGTTGLTLKKPDSHGSTTALKETLYEFTVVGGSVYLTWVPAIQ